MKKIVLAFFLFDFVVIGPWVSRYVLIWMVTGEKNGLTGSIVTVCQGRLQKIEIYEVVCLPSVDLDGMNIVKVFFQGRKLT